MNQPATPTLDPICGMFVDPTSAAGSSTYHGETYSFCSVSCKNTFDAAPEEYARPGAAAAGCCGGHACSTC
jgi:P-type Cu+ transporter